MTVDFQVVWEVCTVGIITATFLRFYMPLQLPLIGVGLWLNTSQLRFPGERVWVDRGLLHSQESVQEGPREQSIHEPPVWGPFVTLPLAPTPLLTTRAAMEDTMVRTHVQ